MKTDFASALPCLDFDEFSIRFLVIGIIINVFICFNVLWGMLMIPNFFYSVSSLLIRNRTWAVRLINIHLTLIWHSQTARRTKKMKLGVLPCLRYHSECMHKVLENKNKAFYPLFWSTFSEYCTFLKTYKKIQATQVCVSDNACCPV